MMKTRVILCCLSAATATFGSSPTGRAQPSSPSASLLPGSSPATTQPEADPRDSRKPQLLAATVDASQSLRRAVMDAALTREITVGQFAYRTASVDLLYARLQNAEQRGGTRWRNDHTCEIMLEISGADVADTLGKIAASHPGDLGIATESLKIGLADLSCRTFSAVGISTGARRLEMLRPENLTDAWRRVSDTARKEALQSARNNAVAHVVESLRCVSIGKDKMMDDALADPAVDAELRQWLLQRPITGVEFEDSLAVSVTLSAPSEELSPAIVSVLQQHHWGPAATDVAAWEKISQKLIRDASPAIGHAIALTEAAPVAASRPATPPVAGPVHIDVRRPPTWVTRQLDADGHAQGQGLRTARTAEDDALAHLRAEIDRLPLGDITVGDAAKRDSRIETAISRAVRCAAPSKVVYGHDNTVKAHVTFLLEKLWREMASEP